MIYYRIHQQARPRSLLPVVFFLLLLLPSPVIMAQDLYPSLEDRELGEPNQSEGDRIIYQRALPFLAQQVLDLGFELPHPYGAQLVGYWQKQDLILDNLSISVNGGPVKEIDFIDFGTPGVENATAQAKLDAWLFPFMNVYATIGKFEGDGTIPLAIRGSDLLDFLGFDGLCNGGVFEPELCTRTLSAVAKPQYNGKNIVLGTILAMGWSNYFVTLPISYALTEVNILNEIVTAWNISPRIGVLRDRGDKGTLAFYVGMTYLKADVDVSGSVAFATSGSGLPGIGNEVVIDYVIRQRNKDRWNYLVGFNWEASKTWSFQAELGFGGSRSNAIASVAYRW